LRLLRGERRADLAQAARSPPDRDALDRGAGAPRAARACLSRRLSPVQNRQFEFFENGRARPGHCPLRPPARARETCAAMSRSMMPWGLFRVATGRTDMVQIDRAYVAIALALLIVGSCSASTWA